jgi:hypothetical protein
MGYKRDLQENKLEQNKVYWASFKILIDHFKEKNFVPRKKLSIN